MCDVTSVARSTIRRCENTHGVFIYFFTRTHKVPLLGCFCRDVLRTVSGVYLRILNILLPCNDAFVPPCRLYAGPKIMIFFIEFKVCLPLSIYLPFLIKKLHTHTISWVLVCSFITLFLREGIFFAH